MERLTYRSTKFNNPVSYGACEKIKCSAKCDSCKINDLIAKLCAYEETGLEPEEIKVHEAAKYNAGYYHGDEDRCRWIEKELGPIDHLRDLLQAEQAGRLLVLPCGTDVNLVRDGHTYKADHWNHTLTAFRDAPENKSGMQVALFSIKEAEAALKGEHDG